MCYNCLYAFHVVLLWFIIDLIFHVIYCIYIKYYIYYIYFIYYTFCNCMNLFRAEEIWCTFVSCIARTFLGAWNMVHQTFCLIINLMLASLKVIAYSKKERIEDLKQKFSIILDHFSLKG